ncbi:MAG: NADPH:quinone oxidoreductase family protein [Proteobacteria bacterium]|nr:NADPH:quinone oxidoreductase family protein [Pseudomonadota bacterium]
MIVEEVPDLTPGDGEIRIAVAAAGVNFADILMVGGGYQESPDFPFTPGLEVAGTVLDCGAGVTEFAPGDRVMAGCAQGGFAEQATVPAGDAYRLPEAMGFDMAGGFPVAYGTAYGALAWRARLKPGETLLVLGAAGGVGLTAVEVGKAMGATVIATARGREKLAVAQEHGADHLIDTGTEDVRAEVRRIAGELGKQGAEVVFDPVGGEIFEASLRCVAWGARLVIIGFAAGRVQQIPANILLVKNVAALGFYWGSYRARRPELVTAEYAQLFDWYAQGKLKPHVSRTLGLAQAAEALELLKTRKSTGKVVLVPGRD